MKIKDDFIKSLLFITFPIVLQSLLTTAVGSADVLMLSYVNQTALSAVSLANQVQFVLNLVYVGLRTCLLYTSLQPFKRCPHSPLLYFEPLCQFLIGRQTPASFQMAVLYIHPDSV